jgi:hypothetical protein
LTIAIRCCQPSAAISNPLFSASAIDARQRSQRSAEHRSAGADGFGLNDQIPAATLDRARVNLTQRSPAHDLLSSEFSRLVDPFSVAVRISPVSARHQPPVNRPIDFRHSGNPFADLAFL